jgi:hypothetical protein
MIVDLHGFEKEIHGELHPEHTKKQRTRNSESISTLHIPPSESLHGPMHKITYLRMNKSGHYTFYPRWRYRIGSNDPEHRTEYDVKATYVLGRMLETWKSARKRAQRSTPTRHYCLPCAFDSLLL